jgi:hypothetical protein
VRFVEMRVLVYVVFGVSPLLAEHGSFVELVIVRLGCS